MPVFSKIKLRTKIGTPVSEDDLEKQELFFSQLEQVVFLKDLNGNILRFLPNLDTATTLGNTWSAVRIQQEFYNFLNLYFDVIDGGTF
jgi:hypothetical protein